METEDMSNKPRSVSQYTEYVACPYRYKLHRVLDLWQRPAAWLPHGIGFHDTVDVFEKSSRKLSLDELEELYRDRYIAEVNEMLVETPRLDHWFSSGPYRAEEDIPRRLEIGVDHVRRYYEWALTTKERPVPWGDDVASEVPFEIDLDGVTVRGYVDQVLQWKVRDLKTGRLPGDAFQLATYAVAMEEVLRVEIKSGDYWMARSGGPTVQYDLSKWTRQRVSSEFHWLDEQIKAEKFEPKPEPQKCRVCPVAQHCRFKV